MGVVMNLKERARQAVMKWVGIQSVVEDSRATPESFANQMDASRITSALIAAEQGYVSELWALYDAVISGDSWIGAMLNQRKLAILNDAINVLPEDPENPDDVSTAESVEASIKRLRRFRMGTLSHLLDGVLRPCSVCEMVFTPDISRPGRYILDRIVPVAHWCQDFRSGHMELLKQDAGNQGRTGTETYPIAYGRHIVHRGHICTAPDNWGGPMRSLIFLWLLKTCNREWWARSLERWGSAIPLGKYPSGDKAAKTSLLEAFSRFHRLGGMAVSDSTNVELIAGQAAGDGSAWERLQLWAERQITIAIVGQDLSSGADSTGLGSGVADLHSRVRDDLILMDELALGETLTSDLAGGLIAANDLPGSCSVTLGTGTNLAKATSLSTILSQLFTAGIEADDDSIDTLGTMMGIGLQRSTRMPGAAPVTSAQLSQIIQSQLMRIKR